MCAELLRHLDGAAVAAGVTTMKKYNSKLTLRGQTIRILSSEALGRVPGGNLEPIEQGFIMKDSVIIRTSGLVQSPSTACR
jgi:hypothetical protein